MDRLERVENLHEALLTMITGWQAGLWTAMPAIINDFDPVNQTCSAQPALQMQVRDLQGTKSWISLPLLQQMPVYFPSGGGYTLTFPVKPGDEALIVFASRCIDSWWQLGKANNTRPDLRMHDLSDGIAFVGIRSMPRIIPNVSIDGVQLRDGDGNNYVDITEGNITIKAVTKLTVNAPTVEFSGNVQVDGTLTGQGTNVHTHTHPDAQGGNTGPPN